MKLGHVRSKTRSVGQILEKPSVPSRGHSFDLKFMKLCQKILEILEKPCVHSRGHSFYPKFMKLCQNVNHHNI